MKNGSISDQLEMQERQIIVERGNTQKNKPVNKEGKKANTDLGLSSALGLLTPDSNNTPDEQMLMKIKKTKRGLRR